MHCGGRLGLPARALSSLGPWPDLALPSSLGKGQQAGGQHSPQRATQGSPARKLTASILPCQLYGVFVKENVEEPGTRSQGNACSSRSLCSWLGALHSEGWSWACALLGQALRFSVRDSALSTETAAVSLILTTPSFAPVRPLPHFSPGPLSGTPLQWRLGEGGQPPLLPLCCPVGSGDGLHSWFSDCPYGLDHLQPGFLISWVNDTTLQRSHKHSVRLCVKSAKRQEQQRFLSGMPTCTGTAPCLCRASSHGPENRAHHAQPQ